MAIGQASKICSSCQLSLILVPKRRKREGGKFESITCIEFVLKLHPVEPQGVQECAQSFHNQQNSNGCTNKNNNSYCSDHQTIEPAHVQNNMFMALLIPRVHFRREEKKKERCGSSTNPQARRRILSQNTLDNSEWARLNDENKKVDE